MDLVFNTTVVAITFYRITALLVGLAFGVMGYKLFVKGIFGDAGDLESKWGDNRLILKRAAPGTFFAVLGAGVLVATLWSGVPLDIEYSPKQNSISTTEAENRVAAPTLDAIDSTPQEVEDRSKVPNAKSNLAADDKTEGDGGGGGGGGGSGVGTLRAVLSPEL